MDGGLARPQPWERLDVMASLIAPDAQTQSATREGNACTDACNRCQYTLDRYATFKRVGDKRVMTRADSRNYAEVVEFVRARGAS
jgi:hypothetical protein